MSILKNNLKRHQISNASQGVKDLFMDLIYNTGNANQAYKIYKGNGVFGLYMALKSSDKSRRIKSVSEARKKMRLELIKKDLQEENLKRAMDDPRDTKFNNENKVDVALIRLPNEKFCMVVLISNQYIIISDS